MALKIFFTSQTDVEILHSHISMAIANCLHWNRCTKYPTDDDAGSWSNKRNWYFAPTALSMVHITTKGLSTMRTKALDNKAQHFHAANGIAIRLLLSLLLCVCHGQYSIHCNSQFTIQMAALFEQSVYYIYVCCVCWLRLERKYSKRVHSSELIFTCLCVCNRGIFVRLMSSVPWPNALDYHHRTHSIERLDYDNVSGFRFTALIYHIANNSF